MMDILSWIDYLWIWEGKTDALVICLITIPSFCLLIAVLEMQFQYYEKPVTIGCAVYLFMVIAVLFPIPILSVGAVYGIHLLLLKLKEENEL